MAQGTRKPPRDIIVVMDRILACVPDGELSALHIRCESLRNSIAYTAPEMLVNRWHELTAILNEEIGKVRTPWQAQMADIFADRL